MSRATGGLVILLLLSESLGIALGQWFYNLYVKTVPPMAISSFNLGTSHAVFLMYGGSRAWRYSRWHCSPSTARGFSRSRADRRRGDSLLASTFLGYRVRSLIRSAPQSQRSRPRCQGNTRVWKDDPDCMRYSELVGIYYRDAWAAKAAATSCTPIAAQTLKRVGEALLMWPGLTFLVGADVPPFVPGAWGGEYINACGGGS